ncbi:MAG: IS66 family transposase [Nitrospiraceae bacterium]
MKPRTPDTLDIQVEDLHACFARVQRIVAPADFTILQALLDAYLVVRQALSAARVSVARLKRLFFGPRTETSRNILRKGPGQGSDPAGKPPGDQGDNPKGKPKRKGHGRNGVDDYPGAERIPVHDESFSVGCPCRHEACDGKLYRLKKPGAVLRIIGQAALKAKVWEPDRWRCGLCGEIFYAQVPPEAQGPKYDATAVAMIGILHFGNGFAFHRQANHQRDLGNPVPASVQSELLKDARTKLLPVFNELKRLAAQGDVVHNDDTTNRILSLYKKPDAPANANAQATEKGERKAIYTTAIVAVAETHQIALYFTGRKHAGENLSDVLELRDRTLAPPTHMSDGLDHNTPEGVTTDQGKCLTHGRRQFVDIATSFPEESRRVIEDLREVYRVDAVAREKKLSPEDRLLLHQEKSTPTLDGLRRWLVDQFLEKNVEPNSTLGKAIQYLLKRWKPLTLFLRKAGAPVDNNIAERVLKLAIRHRRNSLFFKTKSGAAVGDLFMSLIETCRLSGVNTFEYLTTLLLHSPRLGDNPGAWMPWTYQATLAALTPAVRTATDPLPVQPVAESQSARGSPSPPHVAQR